MPSPRQAVVVNILSAQRDRGVTEWAMCSRTTSARIKCRSVIAISLRLANRRLRAMRGVFEGSCGSKSLARQMWLIPFANRGRRHSMCTLRHRRSDL